MKLRFSIRTLLAVMVVVGVATVGFHSLLNWEIRRGGPPAVRRMPVVLEDKPERTAAEPEPTASGKPKRD